MRVKIDFQDFSCAPGIVGIQAKTKAGQRNQERFPHEADRIPDVNECIERTHRQLDLGIE